MKDDILVLKIVRYIDKIFAYCDGVDFRRFVDNSMMVEAVVFNLSQIGELVGSFSDDYKKAHSDIPWKAIRGMRNRIVHDYDGVDLRAVWDVVQNDLQSLKSLLK